jgi:hypothetical protein
MALSSCVAHDTFYLFLCQQLFYIIYLTTEKTSGTVHHHQMRKTSHNSLNDIKEVDMPTFDDQLRTWERLQENLPGGPGYEEKGESCAQVNGENGDCPLDRKTCSGCCYNN